uniref:Uncharacterized protein n=1 Tax=Rhizophora mucronata TaxID=61149 RepID=A0A2P2IMW1_RHIMU
MLLPFFSVSFSSSTGMEDGTLQVHLTTFAYSLNPYQIEEKITFT